MTIFGDEQLDEIEEKLIDNLLPICTDCTRDEISKAILYMRGWGEVLTSELTLDMFQAVFPSFRGYQSELIFNSWKIARESSLQNNQP